MHTANRPPEATEDDAQLARPALQPGRVAVAWGAFLVLAALAWAVTARQATSMGIGPGTMVNALPLFLLMWVVMMAAMMFPSVAPVSIGWARAISRNASRRQRARRMILFVSGYLLAWGAYGLFAFLALLATEHVLETSAEAGRWLGMGVFALAGLYQLTPLKNACLRHCRSPLGQLLQYGSWRGRGRDVRVGFHHGAYCVGCCWSLMLVLVALGVMNLAAMVGLAVVIFLEKLWRHGHRLAIVTGIAFLVIAVLVPFHPSLVPALHSGELAPRMGNM